MKTYSPKPEHIERRWYVVDAGGRVLGRVASEVAALLRGKHKPIFAPHMDTGDHVIVINADKVELTGGKELKKVAYRHSGYPGGITGVRYDELLASRPVFAVEKAVRGMLPKNRLGRAMIRKLHVVAGSEHPHGAQRPVDYTFGQPPRWEGLPGPAVKDRNGSLEEKDEPKPEPAGTAAPAKKVTAKKPTSKKATAKKVTAKKPTAKKTTAKKTTAKKATATAKKPTAKKTTAKKASSTSASEKNSEE